MADRTINQLTAVANVAAADEFEVQKSGETTSKKATLAQLTLLEATARAAGDDAIELASGLNTNGTYPSMSQSWYLKAADFVNGLTDSGGAETNLVESLYNAIRLLDYQTYLINQSLSAVSGILSATVSVSQAEILVLNTVPKVLITCPAGYVVDVLHATAKLTYGTTTYSVGASVNLVYDNGDKLFEFAQTLLESTENAIHRALLTSQEILESSDVSLTCSSNPTTGDSTLTVYLLYRLIAYTPTP